MAGSLISLIDGNGFFRGQIIVTLVNKPYVEEKQAGEYCQSNIPLKNAPVYDEVTQLLNQENSEHYDVRVPLRYNFDKPEKSRIFKGFQGFKPDF